MNTYYALVAGYEATVLVGEEVYLMKLKSGFRGIQIPSIAVQDAEGNWTVRISDQIVDVTSVTKLIK